MLRLPGLFRSVNVRHTGIGAAVVTRNLPTCSITVAENGIWRFAGGTGLFRNAIGNGVFNLTGQWAGNVRTPRSGCSLALFVRASTRCRPRSPLDLRLVLRGRGRPGRHLGTASVLK